MFVKTKKEEKKRKRTVSSDSYLRKQSMKARLLTRYRALANVNVATANIHFINASFMLRAAKTRAAERDVSRSLVYLSCSFFFPFFHVTDIFSSRRENLVNIFVHFAAENVLYKNYRMNSSLLMLTRADSERLDKKKVSLGVRNA